MSVRTQAIALFVAAVAVIAAAVFANGRAQREAVSASFDEALGTEAMLTAMVDQETGLRGYLQTGRTVFLEPYDTGGDAFTVAVARVRRTADASARREHALVDRVETLGRTWRRGADEALAAARLQGVRRVPVREALRRKRTMDELRGAVGRLEAHVTAERARRLDAANRRSTLLVLGLSALFAVVFWLVIGRRAVQQERRANREHGARERQSRFSGALALMDSEADTHVLLKHHLEREVAGSEVHVLSRDASQARLEPATPLGAGSALAEGLVDAEPRTCLAVRLGRAHDGGDDDVLLSCALCSMSGRGRSTCTPLLVSGEVIGSVLVAHDASLARDERRAIGESVTQAAPVLANMRNLAVAERRAATDVLTGLPNRRLAQETLKRMFAHASRSIAPLTAIAIDVDHFKRVNDLHGHEVGDQILAAVGQALRGAVRESDFVARFGGEEFVALLPDTDLDGGLVAAESLRRAVAAIDVLGASRSVTASFGVAAYPVDAHDPETLLRLADRALYAAKEHGRDRVEAARSGLPA